MLFMSNELSPLLRRADGVEVLDVAGWLCTAEGGVSVYEGIWCTAELDFGVCGFINGGYELEAALCLLLKVADERRDEASF